MLFSDAPILNYRPNLSTCIKYEIKQFIVLISPSRLFSTLHRTVHFRSSLIKTPCNNHSHVVLFQFAQYQHLKSKHQLVGFKGCSKPKDGPILFQISIISFKVILLNNSKNILKLVPLSNAGHTTISNNR